MEKTLESLLSQSITNDPNKLAEEWKFLCSNDLRTLRCICVSPSRNIGKHKNLTDRTIRVYLNIKNKQIVNLSPECDPILQLRLNNPVNVKDRDGLENYYSRDHIWQWLSNNFVNYSNLSNVFEYQPELTTKFLTEINRLIQDSIEQANFDQLLATSLSVKEVLRLLEYVDQNENEKNEQTVKIIERIKNMNNQLLMLYVYVSLKDAEFQSRSEIEKQMYQSSDLLIKEFDSFKVTRDLVLAENYLMKIPQIIANNLRKTYLLPDQLWQLQQTNGYISFMKGQFPAFP